MAQRILGIDPGSRFTGYGVIESEGSRLRFLDAGVIALGSGDMFPRLSQLFSELTSLVRHHQPTTCGIEAVFVHKNPMSALKLGQARGAAIAAIGQQGIELSEYATRTVKQAVVGKGSADKEQVAHMCNLLLNRQGKLPLDASDALAIAICHAHHVGTKAMLARGLSE